MQVLFNFEIEVRVIVILCFNNDGYFVDVKDTFKHFKCFLFKLFVTCIENGFLD